MPPAPSEQQLAAQQRLRRLAAATHEHLAPARPGAGLELDVLLAARGRLAPGEVVTVLVPVARALAALHEQRVVLAGLRTSDVRLDAEGRPSLLRRASGAGEAVGPVQLAQDVRSLASVSWSLLTGSPRRAGSLLEARPDTPVPLAALIGGVLQARDGELPSAAEYADALFATCAPVPVAMPAELRPEPFEPGGDGVGAVRPHEARPLPVRSLPAEVPKRARVSGPPRPVGRRRAPRRPRGPVVVAALVVALTATLLALVPLVLETLGDPATAATGPAGAGTPTAATTAPTTAAATANGAVTTTGEAVALAGPGETGSGSEWKALVQQLDAVRAQAWAAGDVAGLAAAYAPGSPALARDAALLASYERAGARTEGMVSVVLAAEEQRRDADSVRLRVRDRMPAHWLRTADGRRTARPARPEREWLLELRKTGHGWRVWEVADL